MSGVNGIFSSSLNRWSKSGKGKSNKKAKKEIFDSNIFSKKGWPRQFDPKPLTTNRPYQTIRSGFNFLVSSSVQSLTLGKIKIEGALLNILQQAVQCIPPLPFDTSMAGLRQTTLEAYNLNNEHPSSSLMLSTTSLSSIALLLPRYLDLYH